MYMIERSLVSPALVAPVLPGTATHALVRLLSRVFLETMRLLLGSRIQPTSNAIKHVWADYVSLCPEPAVPKLRDQKQEGKHPTSAVCPLTAPGFGNRHVRDQSEATPPSLFFSNLRAKRLKTSAL